jgi:hypothetical protein
VDESLRGQLRSPALAEDLERLTGLSLERRAEGVALVNTGQRLTDVTFPGTGTVAQAALLLCARIAAYLPRNRSRRRPGRPHRGRGARPPVACPLPRCHRPDQGASETVSRFEPTRTGIINMWDYRDEEFCFAGGWLVLRGPNGAGKTKALEVLFPGRETAETAAVGLRGRIEQLKASGAYEAHQQMGDLERLVRTYLQAASDAAAELDRRQQATARGRSEAERAAVLLTDRVAVVSRTAAELGGHAAQAGIPWQPADAERADLAERTGARVAVRLEDVRAVRAALAGHQKATHARHLARLTLDRAVDARDAAEQAEQAAAAAVSHARGDAQRTLGDWAARHAGLLPDGQWQQLTEALGEARVRPSTPPAPRPPSNESATSRRRCAPGKPRSIRNGRW